jgi:hypothetical protein
MSNSIIRGLRGWTRFAVVTGAVLAALTAAACSPAPDGSVTSSRDTTPTTSSLAPAETDTPASGICAAASSDAEVVVTLAPDVPTPRCVRVSPDQHLVAVNDTGATTALRLATRTVTVSPGASTTFAAPFASYLAPGVHVLHVSAYGESGAELWLRADTT